MQVEVFNVQNQKVGTVELPDVIFASEISEPLLWEQVKAQRASRRRGTHATKTRGEVSGGGAKPHKQKGTGGARQGSIRAPNHVGGGVVFGPQPRDYSYRLPRSGRKAALRSALSVRVSSAQLVVLDDCKLPEAKTKNMLDIVNRFGWSSALLVDDENNNLELSVRNLRKFTYRDAAAINVYDILDHDMLVLTRSSLDKVIQKAQHVSRHEQASQAQGE